MTHWYTVPRKTKYGAWFWMSGKKSLSSNLKLGDIILQRRMTKMKRMESMIMFILKLLQKTKKILKFSTFSYSICFDPFSISIDRQAERSLITRTSLFQWSLHVFITAPSFGSWEMKISSFARTTIYLLFTPIKFYGFDLWWKHLAILSSMPFLIYENGCILLSGVWIIIITWSYLYPTYY